MRASPLTGAMEEMTATDRAGINEIGRSLKVVWAGLFYPVTHLTALVSALIIGLH
jgi:hypothetical protein